jgi:hypothetical protein
VSSPISGPARRPLVPRWATDRRARLAAGALLACLAALTVTDLRLESHTGLPVGVPMSADATRPDLLFGYGEADVEALFTAYGAAGRRAYAVGLVVDTVYPLVLAAATVLLAARAFASRARRLWAFPVTFAVLDVVENVGFAVALAAYPQTKAGLVATLSPITQAKLLAFPPTVALLLTSAGALSWRWFGGRRGAPHGNP